MPHFGLRRASLAQASALAVALTALTGAARAEESAPPPAVAPAPAPVAVEATTTGPVAEATDHDRVVGHWAFGYFGELDVPIGAIGVRTAGDTAAAQMIGVRRWFGRWRLDVAAGIALDQGTATNASTTADQPSTLIWSAKVAVPYALWVEPHFTVFAGPEVAYGHSGETIAATPATTFSAATAEIHHTGQRISVGGRAGAEIQFGFLGLPHLALDATIALTFDATSGSSDGIASTTSTTGATTTESFSHQSIQSSTGHQPWNIFFSNVAAVYYF
ncbi:MAG: hypothetical protein ACHREM_29955 [Polyangiales bacterium]